MGLMRLVTYYVTEGGRLSATKKSNSRLFEIARVLVRFDYIARCIVNANHGVVRAAEKLCVADCIPDCVWAVITQRTVWERIAD